MSIFAAIFGALLIVTVLFDAFETIVLPRSVNRSWRLTRLFYAVLWRSWSAITRRIRVKYLRQYFLSIFGPLSLIVLFAFWMSLLIFGFALLGWGFHAPLHAPEKHVGFGTYFYDSGVTFFTLGYGDVTPASTLSRAIDVMEAGVGFGVLAIVISYLPVIYQSFSRREVTPLLLDARAGSPPAASTLLQRYAQNGAMDELAPLMARYETWCADLLESFISYPILALYRAQHEQLSWLAALTAMLDTGAIVRASLPDETSGQKHLRWQAQLTFALARHVLVDLSYLLYVPPATDVPQRFSQDSWQRFCRQMSSACGRFDDGDAAWEKLQKLRGEYEPFLFGLSRYLFLEIPPWLADENAPDSWQTSAWDKADQVSHL